MTLIRLLNQFRKVPSFKDRFDSKITLCGDIIGHRIQRRTLFAEALNGTPSAEDATVRLANGQVSIIPVNTRLAVYGDSVIQNHLCRLWLFQGPLVCE